MHGIKIPQQDFVLKMQGGLMHGDGGGGGGGAYLRDTMVLCWGHSEEAKYACKHSLPFALHVACMCNSCL